MTVIYRGIVIFILSFVVKCMFQEKDFWKQATAALVILPLILRALLIK
ncbi:hypothetical protein HMPREF1705_04829 [Acetomicrobium hydrogeniformans ATCC BAA-1850]|jgi:hypothetical protein|uniref:Uncharacterized protein n=1 Tax=Acetomicrobium hydrogeniformans ATCC BAA-1850 TaxID=592015 RepID=A0A0T5X7Y1_9BACT|nr:hypothetical protein HMPREF1705_04829 [Acetomicrobium hydrogeniformans ATCC BAA-1850]